MVISQLRFYFTYNCSSFLQQILLKISFKVITVILFFLLLPIIIILRTLFFVSLRMIFRYDRGNPCSLMSRIHSTTGSSTLLRYPPRPLWSDFLFLLAWLSFSTSRRQSRSWLGWIVKSRQIERRDSPAANRWLAVATILNLSLTENRREGMMVVGCRLKKWRREKTFLGSRMWEGIQVQLEF